jgi:HSP20 family protein
MYFNKIDDDLINRIFNGFNEKALFGCEISEKLNKYIYDVLDNEKDITVHLFVPGVEKDDISVTVANDILEINVKQPKIDAKLYAIKNSKFGDFNVKFKLTDKHNKESVESKLENGILIITIPKVTTSNNKVKVIDIK